MEIDLGYSSYTTKSMLYVLDFIKYWSMYTYDKSEIMNKSLWTNLACPCATDVLLKMY